jgi:hypothetical protein
MVELKPSRGIKIIIIISRIINYQKHLVDANLKIPVSQFQGKRNQGGSPVSER